MKSKRTLLWFVVVLICLVAVLRFRSMPRDKTPAAAATSTTAAEPSPPAETLLIQDGQTIDFSSGQPVITSTPDGADLKADLEAMQAASEGLTFSGDDLPPAPEEPTSISSTDTSSPSP